MTFSIAPKSADQFIKSHIYLLGWSGLELLAGVINVTYIIIMHLKWQPLTLELLLTSLFSKHGRVSQDETGWAALTGQCFVLVEHTFEPVRFFVSDQSDAADGEFFENFVDVSLHRFERQVSYVCSEWRLRRQLLLLPGTSRGTGTRAGADGEEEASRGTVTTNALSVCSHIMELDWCLIYRPTNHSSVGFLPIWSDRFSILCHLYDLP